MQVTTADRDNKALAKNKFWKFGGSNWDSGPAIKKILYYTTQDGQNYGFHGFDSGVTGNGEVEEVEVGKKKSLAVRNPKTQKQIKNIDLKGDDYKVKKLAGKYTEEVFFRFGDPVAMDIVKSRTAVPIQNREDPGCKCCYCCNPCCCIDSWNHCGEGKIMTFGGKQLSSEVYSHQVMFVGHNGSHKIRSNDLYWNLFEIFRSQDVFNVVNDYRDAEAEVKACCSRGGNETEAQESEKERANVRIMEYNDVILYIILGNHEKILGKEKRGTSDCIIDLSQSITEIAAQTRKLENKDEEKMTEKEKEKMTEKEKEKMTEKEKTELIKAYRKKWGGNCFHRFEMDGEFFSFSQGTQTMRHDDLPFHFCWDKVLAVIEYAGGEVTFAHFLDILGLEQRSECGKILCYCCDEDCCGGDDTFCNAITCDICGDSRMWSKPAFKDDKGNVVQQSYCAEKGGPCACCWESCGCQSCCNI